MAAGAPSVPVSQTIAGVRLLNLALDEVVDALMSAVHRGTRTRVAFVNADCINIAARDGAYKRCLQDADWVCADGIGMKIAGEILGRRLRANVNGTDLFPRLCAALAAERRSIYLLGARPGVAEAVAQWAVAAFPGLRLAGARDGYFAGTQQAEVIAAIRATRPDVLMVAMGAPLQETWIAGNLAETGAMVGIGVGGLFDFYSGRIPRAPLWLRKIGGEWLFRLLQEPRRMWQRYLIGNWTFLVRILMEKIRGSTTTGVR
jgi:N-acetylglucosaminyldiphosphoundecaprenol N-acetyl-beta-D-mannosaminyltransferase